MKKLLFAILALAGCASTQPVVQPTPVCPSCPPPVVCPQCPGPVTVHDTVTKMLQDTIFANVFDTVQVTSYLFRDTTDGTIILAPAPDSYPELQAAIDFCIAHPGHKLKLLPGYFHISHPLIAAKISNGDYLQVVIDIEGATNAKNTLEAFTSNIVPDFTDRPALILQNNKGSVIKNIHFGGKYGFANTLSQMQVDTLPFAAWTDGSCRDTRTSPYAAIVIDPFGDPAAFALRGGTLYPGLESYYLPGMDRAGSTAINISGCSIYDFVVGVLVTAAFQYNGELINVTDCRIDNCKVCYAYSQAQSKANTLFDLMVWGNVHTIVDGVNYGFGHDDGSTGPFVDVMNVAGNVHQLFNVYATTFPFSAKRVYAEGLYKIGIVWGRAGTHFDDLQIDFGNTNFGFPTPDFYYQGTNTVWTGCMLRLYNDSSFRLILDCPNNTFIGGMTNAPPVCWNSSPASSFATFQNLSLFYYPVQALNSNNYDSRAYVTGPSTLHVDRSHFTGWFIPKDISQVAEGDMLVTLKQFGDQFQLATGASVPVGFVTGISGDTVRLQNVGQDFHDGDVVQLVNDKINL